MNYKVVRPLLQAMHFAWQEGLGLPPGRLIDCQGYGMVIEIS